MVLTVLTTKKRSDQLEIQFVVSITLKHFRKMWFLFATCSPFSPSSIPLPCEHAYLFSRRLDTNLPLNNKTLILQIQSNEILQSFLNFGIQLAVFIHVPLPLKPLQWEDPAVRIWVADAHISCQNNHFISLCLHTLQSSVKIPCSTWTHPYGVSRRAEELHTKNISYKSTKMPWQESLQYPF